MSFHSHLFTRCRTETSTRPASRTHVLNTKSCSVKLRVSELIKWTVHLNWYERSTLTQHPIYSITVVVLLSVHDKKKNVETAYVKNHRKKGASTPRNSSVDLGVEVTTTVLRQKEDLRTETAGDTRPKDEVRPRDSHQSFYLQPLSFRLSVGVSNRKATLVDLPLTPNKEGTIPKELGIRGPSEQPYGPSVKMDT